MKKYIVYDFRAITNTDDATIISVEDTLEDAIKEAEDSFGGVIYSYDEDGENLINEKFVQSILARDR